ncbi:30S ribosomal protein S4 [Candidatus Micrarchaeota archaeon CG_4_10_14_0_2_um_filter_60_11]|nr:MAG: 30S ribosomal protein S4 [Candidatus Micrarchaeota archaeon CG_4_10_14_0_2_um_filter_60_11]
MGDPRKKRKAYEKPKRLWDSARIAEEKKLREEFGLKNGREVWRAKTMLRKARREARRLLAKKGAGAEKRAEQLLARVQNYFIAKPGATVDDILALESKDILERRLETIVWRKGFASTPKQSRQFITHGHIAIAGHKITIPSYLVKFSEEADVNWYGKPLEAKQPEPTEGKATEEKAVEAEKATEGKTEETKAAKKEKVVEAKAEAEKATEEKAVEAKAEAKPKAKAAEAEKATEGKTEKAKAAKKAAEEKATEGKTEETKAAEPEAAVKAEGE